MSERRRVLCLLPFVPRLDALHGGARASALLVTSLSRLADVGVICIRERGERSADAGMRECCAFLDELSRDALPMRARLARESQARLAALGGAPSWVVRWRVPAFARRVTARLAEWQPDVVQIESPVMAQYAPALRDGRTPIVLTQQEPATSAARERATGARGLGRLRAAAEARGWEAYERAIYAALDAVVTLSERDQREVRALAGGQVDVVRIALGATVPERALDPRGRIPGQVAFVGNFVHPPNVDAAERLIGEIFPRVRARVPDATLQVVGAGASPALRAMAGAGVTVTGEVDDVAPHLDDAAVVAVPLRLGGGARVKVLEAMAAGKAIVASPRAMEGIAIDPGVHVVVAESDAEMASEVTALLEDPVRREALGRAARAWAEAQLGSARVGAEYLALYERLLSRSRR